MKSQRFFILMTMAMALLACEAFHRIDPREKTEMGSLRLNVDAGSASRSLLPDDAAIASYRAYGTGPGGATIPDTVSTSGSFNFPNLALGLWTFTVDGLDANGHCLASGSIEVSIVEGETATGIVRLGIAPGTGTLELTITWPSDYTVGTIIGNIMTMRGDSIRTFSMAVADHVATYSGSAQVGSFVLSLSCMLGDGGTVVAAPRAESVTIMDGKTTAGSYALTSVDFLDIPGLQLQISRPALALTPGESAQLTATLYPLYAPKGRSVTWASDDPNVASVDATGLVTVHAQGRAIISATSGSGLAAYCQIADPIGDVAVIRANEFASGFITSDNALWVCDGGFFSKERDDVADLAIGDRGTFVWIDGSGQLWIKGSSNSLAGWSATPTQVAGMSDMQRVWGGSTQFLALKKDGTLWSAGYNASGELGYGTLYGSYTSFNQIDSEVVSASAGHYSSMYVKTDGSLWATGDNSGRFGNTLSAAMTPVKVLDAGVSAVAVGGWYSLVLMTDGTLVGSGNNDYGQLGDGTQTSRSSFQAIATGVKSAHAGYDTTIFIKDDGSAWATGNGQTGNFGNGDYSGSATPVRIAQGVLDVITNSSQIHNIFTLFLKEDGTLHTSGYYRGNGGAGSCSTMTRVGYWQ